MAETLASRPAQSGPTFRGELIAGRACGPLRARWADLARRSLVPNAFMDPAAALACGDDVRAVLVWEGAGEERLLGAWLLSVSRPAPWSGPTARAPIHSLAYLGTPLLDRDRAAPAFRAMLTALRAAEPRPSRLRIGDLSADGPLLATIELVLAEEGLAFRLLGRRRRAKLEAKAHPLAGGSAKHRRELLRKRRQLERLGPLEIGSVGDPAASLEDFLRLEASGWKGRRGSALACDPARAAFARAFVLGMAQAGEARLHGVWLDGRPLALAVALYSGDAAFTWRIAYDEEFGRFSPGILLLDHVTADLIADPRVRTADSCNHRDEGFQASRWRERHEVVDLAVELRPGRWIGLAAAAATARLLGRAREAARRLLPGLRRSARLRTKRQ